MRILGLKLATSDGGCLYLDYVEDKDHISVLHYSRGGTPSRLDSWELPPIKNDSDGSVRRAEIWNRILPLIFGTSKKSASPMVFCTKADGNEVVGLVERLFPD